MYAYSYGYGLGVLLPVASVSVGTLKGTTYATYLLTLLTDI